MWSERFIVEHMTRGSTANADDIGYVYPEDPDMSGALADTSGRGIPDEAAEPEKPEAAEGGE